MAQQNHRMRTQLRQIDERADLAVTSQMNEGGVLFADGIEQDFLRFDWGVTAKVGISARTLNLVQFAPPIIGMCLLSGNGHFF